MAAKKIKPCHYVHSKGHGFVLPKFKNFGRFAFELVDKDAASNKCYYSVFDIARGEQSRMNQGKMQLNETALKFTSEQLNTLAKKKEDLEKYLNDLNYQPQDSEAIKEQVLFVENQIRLLMQGWAKATPATKKRLLRRTIKEIVITRGEIHICFWLNAHELDFGRDRASGASPEDAKNIIHLRRFSPGASDRNLSFFSSGKVRIGRPEANILKPTELRIGRAYKVQWKKERTNPEELARLYWVQGLSQLEIARLHKIRRSTISAAVKKFQPVG